MQVAIIMNEQNRLEEAYQYVEIAHTSYKEFYGEDGESQDNSIISLWLKLEIAYY